MKNSFGNCLRRWFLLSPPSISVKFIARNFIQLNSELRHQKELEDKVSFIYTGSISLFPMIEKITSLKAVNDLKIIEVEPLSTEEAKDFLTKLMSNEGMK